MASSTTSIRIPDDLKDRLESAARRMNKGKNWIIKEALAEYLQRHNMDLLRAEARRQSIAASKKKWKDAKLWEEAVAEVWDAD
ncbi:MAG: ribbon-helix-helix domain-containing protein [Acidobacteriia bacterium]|nr:ribbon-helix-helix domain-containing protein [Terriglobia bacterium]